MNRFRDSSRPSDENGIRSTAAKPLYRDTPFEFAETAESHRGIVLRVPSKSYGSIIRSEIAQAPESTHRTA